MQRIIIVGKAGSGKDYLREHLQKIGLRHDVSITTRPIRLGEIPGVTYHYLSKEEFTGLVKEGSFHEHVTFNGWGYGTLKESWEKSQVFIMTPSGVKQLKKEDRKQSLVVYLDIGEEVRKERLSKRSDADSVSRRLAADEKDFSEFVNYDIIVTDPLFNAPSLAAKLKSYLS